MAKHMQWPVKDDQFARIPEYREKWLKFILGNRESSYLESPSEVTSDIQWLYKESHLPVPQQIVIANSPQQYSDVISRNRGHQERRAGRAVQVAALDNGVTAAIESGVWGNVYHAHAEAINHLITPDHRKLVSEQVVEQMRRPLLVFFNSVFNRRANVWNVESQKLGLLSDGPWLTMADFYDQVCGITQNDDLRRYVSFLKKGVFELTAFGRTAVILNAPREVYLNDEFRPHSISKPAITWRDGSRNYYLHGIPFNEELWRKVKDRTITAKETMSLRNIEQRTIALRIIGYDRVLQELGAKILDRKDVVAQPSGRKIHYEVLEADLQDDRPWAKARFVKVQCPSTMKETVIRVDSATDTAKVDGAVAWTFGLRPEQYNPELET